jgi:hypothetical protein
MKTNKKNLTSSKIEGEKLAALNYPPSEDIYAKLNESKDIDPEDVLKRSLLSRNRNPNGMKKILERMFQVLT